MELKTCGTCCKQKDILLFAKDKSKPNGRSTVCKQCRSEYQVEWQKTHPQKLRIYTKRWREKNKEHCREVDKISAARRRAEKPDQYRKQWKIWSLHKNYGVTLEWFENKSEEQQWLCKICGMPPGKKGLAVDHCHKTGKVRDLLCTHCNTLLHKMEQNIEWIRKAEAYLRRHDAQPDITASSSDEEVRS